ncbi:MAG: DUF5615 family PIN-like protein [Saccharolobus sp.]|jgi:hypothetical protein|uniref:Mut7-C RNAse domain-containing protein n=1 Tax=Saccharolobus sp. TaxID=2100761 RepID=UPI0028CCE4A4|nr:DUF5615 family PIN-like protein [Saccharolobus sp.]MDT7861455.1 DUF5615 family PIN-like protein [Saccharolobus sp.]
MLSQKFIVDAMLGRVARWLRIMGYDTLYSNKFEDWKILKIAESQNRIIITRDRGLYRRSIKRGLKCILLDADSDIVHNLAYIAYKSKIDLSVNIDATRCAICNSLLKKVSENRWICPKCKKEYWKGKHWKTIEEVIIKANSELIKLEEKNASRGVSANPRIKQGNRSIINRDS